MCLRTLGNIFLLNVSFWKVSICHVFDGMCMCVDRVLCWDMRSSTSVLGDVLILVMFVCEWWLTAR